MLTPKHLAVTAILVGGLIGVAMLGFLGPATVVSYTHEINSSENVKIGTSWAELDMEDTYAPGDRLVFKGLLYIRPAKYWENGITSGTLTTYSYYINYYLNGMAYKVNLLPVPSATLPGDGSTLTYPFIISAGNIPIELTSSAITAEIQVRFKWSGIQQYVVPFGETDVETLKLAGYNGAVTTDGSSDDDDGGDDGGDTAPGHTWTATVVDKATGNAISGATVVMGSSTAYTSSAGVATFTALDMGTYTQTISASGYQTITRTYIVSDEDGESATTFSLSATTSGDTGGSTADDDDDGTVAEWDWMPLIICGALGGILALVLALPFVPGPLPMKLLIGIIILTVLLAIGFMLSAGMISLVAAGVMIV